MDAGRSEAGQNDGLPPACPAPQTRPVTQTQPEGTAYQSQLTRNLLVKVPLVLQATIPHRWMKAGWPVADLSQRLLDAVLGELVLFEKAISGETLVSASPCSKEAEKNQGAESIKKRSNVRKNIKQNKNSPRCYYCNEPGHLVRECWQIERNMIRSRQRQDRY